MSDLRPIGIPIIIDGVERHLLFTLNVIDKIQDKYEKPLSDVLEDVTNSELSDHLLRDVLIILLNDETEREIYKKPECGLKPVTEQEIGWFLCRDNQYEVMIRILKAYGVSIPEPDEDEDPNVESGQQSS